MAEKSNTTEVLKTLEQVKQFEEAAKIDPNAPKTTKEAREDRRFQQQFDRDKKRGRLSWQTKNALEQRTLNAFANSLFQEKSTNSQIQDIKNSEQALPQQITQESRVIGGPAQAPPKNIPPAPRDLESMVVRACINGQAADIRVFGGFIRTITP